MREKPICILGGGLSGLCFAYFSRFKSVMFEKEERLGGLCRSFDINGICCDIGPHIFFSRDKEALDFLTSLTPMHKRRRSNKIFYKDIFVKYPFENELSALPDEEKEWCLNTFLKNPYVDYDTPSMLMFFYKMFGEGITRAYLEPYNRKIWKFEPSFMDTQIVERIPEPQPHDIIASAEGISTEGYLHQLYFWYPNRDGTESIIRSIAKLCGEKLDSYTSTPLEKLRCKRDGSFIVTAGCKDYEFKHVVSTIPIQELVPCIEPGPPEDVKRAISSLKYNSIHITVVNTREDNLGDNFAVMVPQQNISFHRVSKPGFLGENYRLPNTSTIMAEITFRKGACFDMQKDDISELVVRDLQRIGFVPSSAVNSVETKSFKYAYVIYDLNHRRNTDKILAWLKSLGIMSVGRFAAFEYINMDKALTLAKKAALEGHVPKF